MAKKTTAKAVEAVETATAAEVKTVAEEVKAEAAPAEEKKPVAKKAATKKTTVKKETAAKKETVAKKETASKSVTENVYYQYQGTQIDLLAKAKELSGIKNPKIVNVYVKPEDGKVYYVVDNNAGDFDL